jgi:hypothetical protein
MWSPRLENVDIASALVGATVSCSLLAQRLFTRQSELSSEILSWTILPILLKINRWPNISAKRSFTYPDTQPTSSKTLWMVAASLTIASVYKAENGIVELSVIATSGTKRVIRQLMLNSQY